MNEARAVSVVAVCYYLNVKRAKECDDEKMSVHAILVSPFNAENP